MVVRIITIIIIIIIVIDINIIITINDIHIKVEEVTHITISQDKFNLVDNTFMNINHNKGVKPLWDIIMSSIMIKYFKGSKYFMPNDLKDNYLLYVQEAYLEAYLVVAYLVRPYQGYLEGMLVKDT